jgi:hypothetical protein
MTIHRMLMFLKNNGISKCYNIILNVIFIFTQFKKLLRVKNIVKKLFYNKIESQKTTLKLE